MTDIVERLQEFRRRSAGLYEWPELDTLLQDADARLLAFGERVL